MARVRRRVYINVGDINWHPFGGPANSYGGSWNGKILVDTPYYNREGTDKPPSHYTICAKYNPIWAPYPSPAGLLKLGEIVTVMAKDALTDDDIQLDFIAGIWPGVNYSAFGNRWAGDMTNGHLEGTRGNTTWVPRTQYDGMQDQGVTCEEWASGVFFHSNTHRVRRGEYIPPTPVLGHPVVPPTMFGSASGDMHLIPMYGIYDCKAEDIVADPNYLPIMQGDITLTIKASYDMNTAADIRVNGEPVPYEVRARVVPASGYIADTPAGGNFPASYLVTVDPGIVANVGMVSAPLDMSNAQQGTTLNVQGGEFDPTTGFPITTMTTISDPSRGLTLIVENNESPAEDPQQSPPTEWSGWSPASPVNLSRGETLYVTAPINSGPENNRLVIYNIDGTYVYTDQYGGLQTATSMPGRPHTEVSAPLNGQAVAIGIDVNGGIRVETATQQDVNGEVTAQSLNDQPEAIDVAVDATISEDPTDAPDETALSSDDNMSAGAPEDGNGASGPDDGNGDNGFAGNGGGPAGGDGDGGSDDDDDSAE